MVTNDFMESSWICLADIMARRRLTVSIMARLSTSTLAMPPLSIVFLIDTSVAASLFLACSS
ncbi:hypothetical protein LP420_28925 [Massilia sp. B-10]|nr:hypothetical protein LP420_28925 [Massilia sp. B-10]